MIKQTYSAKIVEVFKTDVQDLEQSKSLIKELTRHIPGCHINFDLEDCDHILRVEGENVPMQNIIIILNNRGYICELLS